MKVLTGHIVCVLFASAPSITVEAGPAAMRPMAAACPHLDGYIDGPFVPTAAAARRVYLAVRDAVAPDLRSQRHVRVVVEDEGGRWSVYSSMRVEERSGHLTVLMGGGGLGLKIDKCSGAISNVALQR
jgi:hypothetical protein